MRDYTIWLTRYDDPDSDLSWRLRVVQAYIRAFLDAHPGPTRILSSCAGDGRDVLGVLADRDDQERVTLTLLEVNPDIAARAEAAAGELAARCEIRVTDAGTTDAYRGAVAADLVLLVGIFGNISDADLDTTIAATPALCAGGGWLIWSRGRDRGDRNPLVRRGFESVGFTEMDYAASEDERGAAIGLMRYDGEPQPLPVGQRLFTFER